MRRISASMILGLAFAAMTACSTGADKTASPQGELGQIKMSVVLAPGNTLDSVTWTLSCTTPPPVTTGTWNISHSATISGVIGGVPAGDVCSLLITGTDTLGKAGGLTNNCTGTAANISAGSTGAISVTCADPGDVNPAGTVTSIGTTATVTTSQAVTHTCAGVASYTASPGEVYVGNTIALTVATTTLTAGDTATITWSTSSDGTLGAATGASSTFTCVSAGTKNITVSVQDNITGYTSTCPASTVSFPVTCTAVPGSGTGGAPATGGAATGGALATGGAATGGTPATGGAATGGTPAAGGAVTGGTPATGGAATGGTPATGGAATGGTPATGGAATGGTPATGGAATGGTPATGGAATGGRLATGGAATGGASSLSPELSVLNAISPACLACAQSKCGADAVTTSGTVGPHSCDNLTGNFTAQVADSADGIKVGDTVSQQVACANLAKCVITQGCFAKGNTSELFGPCYCTWGTSTSIQSCLAAPPTGVCAAQYDIALNGNGSTGTTPAIVQDTPHNAAGAADELAICLASATVLCTSCM